MHRRTVGDRLPLDYVRFGIGECPHCRDHKCSILTDGHALFCNRCRIVLIVLDEGIASDLQAAVEALQKERQRSREEALGSAGKATREGRVE